MSSKKLVYFLLVSLVYGFVAGGIAYGQSVGNMTFKGTVTDADGEPVGGYKIEATTIPVDARFFNTVAHSRSDGSYTLGFLSFQGGKLSTGTEIKITATDSQDNVVGTVRYTLTAENIDTTTAVIDVSLSGLSVELEKNEVPADGISTSQITVTVKEGGNPVTGDTVTISADRGSVSTPTDNGDGTYSATYTAPSLALTAPMDDGISVQSDQLDQEKATSIRLTVVPTTVDVTVDPNQFTADTPGTGAVTITVKRGADLISDETVTVGLSRSDGKADTGTISL